MEYIIFFLFVLALTFSAARDKLKQHWNNSIFKYWMDGTSWQSFFEPSSWRNKYQKDKNGKLIPHPTKEGKFLRKRIILFGWNTGIVLPVVFTNAWHLLKGLEIAVISAITCLSLVLTGVGWLQYWGVNFIGLIIIWGVLFELLYSSLFEIKLEDE